MQIPKIIHQTWKNDDLPEKFISLSKTIKKYNPDWEYNFYTDADIDRIIRSDFNEYYDQFCKFKHPVQKADFFRLAIVYQKGGFYADMDIEAIKSFNGDLLDNECIFPEEKTLTDIKLNELNIKNPKYKDKHVDKLRIGNYMFGSIPNHPFLKLLMNEIILNTNIKVKKPNDIIMSTGPGIVTYLYHKNKADFNITIVELNSENYDGPTCTCNENSCRFGHYAVHRHTSSWWNTNPWQKRLNKKIRIVVYETLVKRFKKNSSN